MKISFDTNNLHGLFLPQFFLLAFFEALDPHGLKPEDQLDIYTEFLQNDGFLDDYRKITDSGKEILKNILANIPDIKIDVLAREMREIYPKGTKPETPYKWTSNPKEIMDKLKRFFMIFNEENITEEEVIQATKNYVEKMKYDVHMRLLKYFILKANSDKDKESDLFSEICLIREGEDNTQYDNTLI